MVPFVTGRAAGAALLAVCAFAPFPALAQSSPPATSPAPELVITPTRTLLDPAKSGSALTVVTAAEIDRAGGKGIADVLRQVPGLDVVETGGTGSTVSVSLRGAQDGQTLIMLDGVRIGDPTLTTGQVDLGQFAVTDIERIEVLRGPQSALYGSDAMGGVINIITRRGSLTPRREVTLEGGSYGTIHTRGRMSGTEGNLSYDFAIDALHSDGFPRFGYRINRPIFIDYGALPLPPLPNADPVNRTTVTGRISYAIDADTRVDAGIAASGDWLHIDNPGATMPSSVFDSWNNNRNFFLQGWSRLTHNAFDGRLRNQFSVFANTTDRTSREREQCYDPSTYLNFDCTQGFRGTRTGGEYQGDLKLGAYGLLTFGLHNENETAATSQSPHLPGTFTAVDARQTTNAVFAQHQITLFNRLDLSVGGRVDDVVGGPTFVTGRATAAYRIEETGTKLRASLGNGARNPSLFQRYSQYGSPGLLPERNVAVDFGIDQKLWDGRVVLGATAFFSRYRDLIGFGPSPTCTPAQLAAFGGYGGCYYNVNRALSNGLEVSGDVVIVPDEWKARVAYTHMLPKALSTGQDLYRRPRDKVAGSLVWTGYPKLEVEGRATWVGRRLDVDFYQSSGLSQNVWLAPYLKLDVFASYKLNETVSAFGRVENLTNARYEEVLDYGTAGRSFYAGVKMTW